MSKQRKKSVNTADTIMRLQIKTIYLTLI